MTDLIRNLGYALRQLRRSPGFATVAILTLAVGIGGNSMVFALMDAVLLRAPAVLEGSPPKVLTIHK